MMLDAMCGFDPRDSTSLEVDPPNCMRGIEDSPKQLTIGVPEEYFAQGLDPTVGESFKRLCRNLNHLVRD